MQEKIFKKRMTKKGCLDRGDMMIQMFMPKPQTLYLAASFAEIDPLGKEQPLYWLEGHYKAKHLKGPSKADVKLEEAFAHYDIEDEQLDDANFLELGGSPGGWSNYLLEKGANVISVDLAPTSISHKKYQYIQGDANDLVDNFKDSNIDFLVADLSIPPFKSLDLLFRYLNNEIPQRFIWSIKFSYHPDKNWNLVVQSAKKMLREQVTGYDFRIRHMFYQKKEILIWGHKKQISDEFFALQDELIELSDVEVPEDEQSSSLDPTRKE